MFTGRTLPLSEFDGRFGLEVVRTCDFAFVGKVPTRLGARLVPCTDPHLIAHAARTEGVAGVVTTRELAPLVPGQLGLAVADNPQAAAYDVHDALLEIAGHHWESFPSRIDPTAQIDPHAIVAEHDVVIGARSVVEAGAVIRPRTVIGDECLIGAGAVLGCDAFEVDLSREPRRLLRQAGGVRLADHVDVLAKCTIVRATFGGFTEIGAETKIDCQIHVAHDCVIGRRVRIAACAELSGRVTVGDDVYIGPNATISNGLTIGDRAFVTLGAVVVRNVKADQKVTGNLALPHDKWLKFVNTIR